MLEVFNRYGGGGMETERERPEIESICVPRYYFLLLFIKAWLPRLQFSLTLPQTRDVGWKCQHSDPFSLDWTTTPGNCNSVRVYPLPQHGIHARARWAAVCMVWFYRGSEFCLQLIFSASLPLCVTFLQLKSFLSHKMVSSEVHLLHTKQVPKMDITIEVNRHGWLGRIGS